MTFDQEPMEQDFADFTNPKYDMNNEEIEVNSAFGADEMLKMRMYQEEMRYSS